MSSSSPSSSFSSLIGTYCVVQGLQSDVVKGNNGKECYVVGPDPTNSARLSVLITDGPCSGGGPAGARRVPASLKPESLAPAHAQYGAAVRPSDIHGSGLFATRGFKKGEVIISAEAPWLLLHGDDAAAARAGSKKRLTAAMAAAAHPPQSVVEKGAAEAYAMALMSPCDPAVVLHAVTEGLTAEERTVLRALTTRGGSSGVAALASCTDAAAAAEAGSRSSTPEKAANPSNNSTTAAASKKKATATATAQLSSGSKGGRKGPEESALEWWVRFHLNSVSTESGTGARAGADVAAMMAGGGGGGGLYPYASRINHACANKANVWVFCDDGTSAPSSSSSSSSAPTRRSSSSPPAPIPYSLTVTAARDIAEGEELLRDYTDGARPNVRAHHTMLEFYGIPLCSFEPSPHLRCGQCDPSGKFWGFKKSLGGLVGTSDAVCAAIPNPSALVDKLPPPPSSSEDAGALAVRLRAEAKARTAVTKESLAEFLRSAAAPSSGDGGNKLTNNGSEGGSGSVSGSVLGAQSHVTFLTERNGLLRSVMLLGICARRWGEAEVAEMAAEVKKGLDEALAVALEECCAGNKEHPYYKLQAVRYEQAQEAVTKDLLLAAKLASNK